VLPEPDTDHVHTQTDAAQADAASAAPESALPANTYVLFGIKRLWSVVAGLCLLITIVLAWRNRLDATFVVATLGVVAWFLDLRNRLRPRSIEANSKQEDVEEVDDEQ
jgi:hypothetical protein